MDDENWVYVLMTLPFFYSVMSLLSPVPFNEIMVILSFLPAIVLDISRKIARKQSFKFDEQPVRKMMSILPTEFDHKEEYRISELYRLYESDIIGGLRLFSVVAGVLISNRFSVELALLIAIYGILIAHIMDRFRRRRELREAIDQMKEELNEEFRRQRGRRKRGPRR